MAKTWAMVFGWVLLVLGVLGFISNPIIGAGAYFHTDMMHNIIHIILGALLLWAAYSSPMKSASMLKWIGVIFLVLAVLGWLTVGSSTGSLLGIAEANGADNWLHLVLGLVFFWLGWKGHKGGAMASAQQM